MNYKEMADELTSVLGLSVPPISISFCSDVPETVPAFQSTYPEPMDDGRTGAVSAGCVFWVKSLKRTFVTTAPDHGNCSVGSLTHGFISVEEAGSRADVAAMCEANWVRPEIFPDIPVVKSPPAAIVYGPLSDCESDPDVIFIRLIGKQVMQLHSSVASLRFEGKPQCHIIPLAKEHGEISVSLGCMLSRVRTGIPNNEVTCAIPFQKLPEVIDGLKTSCESDHLVAAYAADDIKRFQ